MLTHEQITDRLKSLGARKAQLQEENEHHVAEARRTKQEFELVDAQYQLVVELIQESIAAEVQPAPNGA